MSDCRPISESEAREELIAIDRAYQAGEVVDNTRRRELLRFLIARHEARHLALGEKTDWEWWIRMYGSEP